MSHRDSRVTQKKHRKDEVETLAERFHSMHLHHIPVPTHDELTCKHKFKHALKKWTGSSRHKTSYSDVCHIQKGTKNPSECKYIIKVFHEKDQQNPALFRHECRVLKELEEHKLNITPHLYSLFSCGRYGLIVMDKWDGDMLELIFSHQHFTMEALQTLYHKVRFMVETLHKAGWSHGRINFHNIIFQHFEGGLRLGLVSWAHARAFSNRHQPNHRDMVLIKSDINDVDVMFMELFQTINALNNHEPLPLNLPHALKARFVKVE